MLMLESSPRPANRNEGTNLTAISSLAQRLHQHVYNNDYGTAHTTHSMIAGQQSTTGSSDNNAKEPKPPYAKAQNKGKSPEDMDLNFSVVNYNQEPNIVHYKDGWSTVEGITGKFLGKWFLPKQMSQVGTDVERAYWMRIKILTGECLAARQMRVLNNDEIYRESIRYARCVRKWDGPIIWIKVETNGVEGSGGTKVEPKAYDVLVRLGEPHGQCYRNHFYGYLY
ncbi:uncharacterized protein LOC117170001 [Belonocnema kinseyi]|uniref:uncharacterized protein LOC117170001 n=1 Tax=Belonocnema kinseyi TaxID=2817044 RepID=UPI00143E0423|nr:uncharacterized protein LOC117170001 [Belonocnema kinseyi]